MHTQAHLQWKTKEHCMHTGFACHCNRDRREHHGQGVGDDKWARGALLGPSVRGSFRAALARRFRISETGEGWMDG